jgi:hypothetical protein
MNTLTGAVRVVGTQKGLKAMKTFLTTLALITLPLLAIAIGGQTQKGEEARRHLNKELMKSKLENSKKILEGLATEDFNAIRKGAKAMRDLTVLERWALADTPRYKAQLNVFWFANDALIQAADEKNLDGATLAYTQQTLSCVNCHKYVRTQVTAQLFR